MAVVIRMARYGKTGTAFYRLVATDKRYSRDGRHLEILGTYNPADKQRQVKVKTERLQHWILQGAKPSDTVSRLLKLNGVATHPQN